MLKRNMKYWLGMLLIFCLCQPTCAQTLPTLPCESDEYSTYLIPSLENGFKLLEANQALFQRLMKQYQYQEFQEENKLKYLAPTSRVNQLRLISKENRQVQFLFSPTKLSMIQQLEKDIFNYKPVISTDSTGMTWYQIVFRSINTKPQMRRIGIKKEMDSEDRVGRTWTIWSSTIIFSYE